MNKMKIRTLQCSSCGGYSNVKGTFKKGETYNCVHCGALNSAKRQLNKFWYRLAIALTIIVGLLNLQVLLVYFDNLSAYLIFILACIVTYYGTILFGKIMEWIVED